MLKSVCQRKYSTTKDNSREYSLPDDFQCDIQDVEVKGILFQALSLSDANENNENNQIRQLREYKTLH